MFNSVILSVIPRKDEGIGFFIALQWDGRVSALGTRKCHKDKIYQTDIGRRKPTDNVGKRHRHRHRLEL
jgi:hypothetical protein